MRTADLARQRSFAVKPDEAVASFALISSVMPRGIARPRTYRAALLIAVGAALVAALLGLLPVAVLLAALGVPLVYIVYVYDVNLWEDEPIWVSALAFLLTGVLGAALLVAVRTWGPEPTLEQLPVAGGPSVVGFLTAALLVPVLGEIVRQIGPLILASRPRFDDLMDGLTFGIISGVAYSAADTIVRHWSEITGGLVVPVDPLTWIPLIFLEGLVKPLLIGTATGIACAEFAGLGTGYDGFTLRYLRGLVEAIGANVAFGAAMYLLGFVTQPALRVGLQLVCGAVILAILIIRVRTVLHVGLMEAALEHAARRGVGTSVPVGATGDLQVCRRCEMPLLSDAEFCTACGTAVQVWLGHGQR
ncbi:protease PrsW [Granulicoccus phenolivorans]|uniref:protease PrsW n=1 Tax=Granulicoccus phenolivorans TaxID=266854 RepID=UPI000687C5B1|nr:protease PrsW [Granulicoccus phenolivorans]